MAAEPLTLAEELVEELQQEHPDAEPELIEDAVQQAMDELAADDLRDEEIGFEFEPVEDGGEIIASFEQDEPEPWGAGAELDDPEAAAPLITPPPAPTVDTSAILAEAQQQASQI